MVPVRATRAELVVSEVGEWRSSPTDAQVAKATELMFDAFDAAGMAERGKYSVGYYIRPLDDIEASVANMARALLAAGWKMP